jgi:hypothetical protein
VTLQEVLATVAADVDDVAASSTPAGGTDWSRGADVFASLASDGRSAEFRLDSAIADAAIRTPDTGPSTRGRGWVRFAPVSLDGHAVDRATAWFMSACRRTTTG